jgi:superfamily II DNA/RNA helicase
MDEETQVDQSSLSKLKVLIPNAGECNDLVMNEKLVAMGAQALHGDIAQNQRETTMAGFRKGTFSCLITTNVCARGVDIPEVDLIIVTRSNLDVRAPIRCRVIHSQVWTYRTSRQERSMRHILQVKPRAAPSEHFKACWS